MRNWKTRAGASPGRGWILAVFAAILLSQPSGAVSLLKKKKPPPDPSANKPRVASSQPPAFSIPVEPLGFSAPGQYYEGARESLVSLDFLDENRLLFTFRAPGLIHRTVNVASNERQIRAQVLTLPQGATESETVWTLHDHDRYLWMLGNGHFLLRDGDQLKEGDATLELKPWLQFPGHLLSVDLDPSQQYLVTNSREPADVKAQPGQVDSPATASADVTDDDPKPKPPQPDIVLRIMQRKTGKVMLVSRVRSQVRIAINAEGYLETLRSTGRDWMLNLNFFAGGNRVLGKVESACEPPVDFVAHSVLIANLCSPQGGRSLVAMNTTGQKLWDAPSPPTQVWPLFQEGSAGTRLARETLTVNHPIDAFSPLSIEDVTGQLVEVFDTAKGNLALKAPASPVLDGGGNVAISPSGKRVAVLNGGAIEVYELPTPPEVPAGTKDSAH